MCITGRPRTREARPLLAGTLVIPLAGIRRTDVGRVGGKAANLGEMMAAGLPVPAGFCITTDAFDRFLKECPPRAELFALLSERSCDGIQSFKEVHRNVSAMLRNVGVPSVVKETVLTGWGGLVGGCRLAVRSSATVEDSPELSFAGQFDSFLNVSGADGLLAALRRCWLSLYSEPALAYLAKQRVGVNRVKMAVVVQQMVAADWSGVVFTADPLTGATDRLVVEYVPGLGEELVRGTVRPEQMLVDRMSGRVLTTSIEEPGRRSADSGVPANSVAAETLDDKAVCAPSPSFGALAKLSDLADQTERWFGSPQDIEWSICDEQVYLLQARPITSHPPVKSCGHLTSKSGTHVGTVNSESGVGAGRLSIPSIVSSRMPVPRSGSWEDRQVWTNLNSGEVMPDVMTPITWTLIQLLFDSVIRRVCRLIGIDARKHPGFGLVAGRGYFNVNACLAALKPFWFLLRRIPNAPQAFGGGETEIARRLLQSIPDEDLPDLGFRWPKYILSWPRILYDLITHSPRRGDAWMLRLKAQIDELARDDVTTKPTPELVLYFTRLLRHGFESWDLLYLVTQVPALPIFQMTCHKWLNDPGLTLGYRLFSGLGGVPEVEAGLALWRLAALAHGDLQTESALVSGGRWEDVLAKLQQSDHGPQFVAAWDAFMSEHGHHSRGELELFNARWSEKPDYILGLVRGYLRSMDQLNPLENQLRLAEERRELTEQCRRRLKNPVKRWIFWRSLRRAQTLAVHREVWKSQAVRQIAVFRNVLLTLGQRLSEQGTLADRDDIFFLEVSEVEPVALGKAHFDVRERIAARRKEYRLNLATKPPPVVAGRFWQNPPEAPVPERDPDVLEGIPVSPGIVTGRAKVILRNDDHEHVLPGEILIAPFTDPAWTPYFVTAAGVVMDLGGILSHGSIVAREYGLPAVTNVGSATHVIRTGDQVQVDGNSGRVIILNRADQRPNS